MYTKYAYGRPMEWMNSPSLALTRHSSTISLSLFIKMAVATFAGPMARQWQHTQYEGGLLHATNHGHRVIHGIQGVPHGQALCFTKQSRVPGAPAGGASHWREGEGRRRVTCWMPAGRESGWGKGWGSVAVRMDGDGRERGGACAPSNVASGPLRLHARPPMPWGDLFS